MPRIVDHDQRRGELAEIAARLIAQGGVEAATVRAVALAAGYSTKVVSHYFADKQALMLLTYRHAVQKSQALTEASQPPGRADVTAFLHALLPITDAVRQNWLVWLAFWALAITDEPLAAEQRQRVKHVVDRLEGILAHDPRFASLPAASRQQSSTSLYSTVLGIAMQAVFDPAGWPASRQAGIVAAALDALAPPGG